MTEPAINSTAAAQIVVGDFDLASALPLASGDAFPAVLATARMVALMEIASARLLHSCLCVGELSVGVSVDVTHTAPTPKGATVRAEARYLGRDGKLFLFRSRGVGSRRRDWTRAAQAGDCLRGSSPGWSSKAKLVNLRVRAKINSDFGGARSGQMRGAREGVYPQRYSTTRATKKMARWRAPGWGSLAGRFVAHSLQTAAGMLVVRASPARQIASSKIGSYFCTDPKRG